MDVTAELGRNPASKHRIQSEYGDEQADRTAEPVSRDQILRHARGQGKIIFPVQLTTSRIGNLTRLIYTLLYVMTVHTYIHTYTRSRVTLYYVIILRTSRSGKVLFFFQNQIKTECLELAFTRPGVHAAQGSFQKSRFPGDSCSALPIDVSSCSGTPSQRSRSVGSSTMVLYDAPSTLSMFSADVLQIGEVESFSHFRL